MRLQALGGAALAFLTLLTASAPPAPRSSMLVSTAWLAQKLRDPNVVVLHIGSRESYAQHIPGARFVTLDDISVSDHSGGNMLELPSPGELRRRLAALGISNSSRVVVTFEREWISPATRILFTLGAAGLGDRAALLDGGMAAWLRERRPTTATAVPARTGTLGPLRMQPWTVDATFVRTAAGRPGFALIDARAPALFDGVQVGGSHGQPHKRGHIPGARNIPFTALADSNMRVRPAAELAAMFQRAGVKRGDTVIVYCHIGQQGTAIVFAARSLGYRAVLYDGSFEDWSRRNLPAEARVRG